MMSLLLLSLSPALAGYGDVDEDGYPSWGERDLHLWTNAVRVDPEAFSDEYEAGGCSFDSFEASEQTPKSPLFYDRNLNIAGRYHSQDMHDNNWFDHDSSDGTSFAERMARYYESSMVGENIAQGYPDEYSTVTNGWMCSDGHRANIMLASYTELGTGVVSNYYTQDFGGGTIDTDGAVAMSTHSPELGDTEMAFFADYLAEAGPEFIEVVINGEAHGLSLEWGAPEAGVYAVDAEVEEQDCNEYYIRWITADGDEGVFPEEGSYVYGGACDNTLGWVEGHAGANGSDEDAFDGIRVVGCASAGAAGAASGLLAFFALGLVVTRRRA